MAETLTIQQRLALLDLEQVGSRPKPAVPKKKSAPALPPRLPPRSLSTDNQPVIQGPSGGHGVSIGNQPALRPPDAPVRVGTGPLVPPILPRRTSCQPPPTTPARRPSEMSLGRKTSQESVMSNGSTTSTSALSRTSTQTTNKTTPSRSPSYDARSARTVKAPDYDPSHLPTILSPKRSEQPKVPERPANHSRISSLSLPPVAQRRASTQALETLPKPSPSPQLPRRDSHISQAEQSTLTTDQSMSQRRESASMQRRPKRSALEWGMNNVTEEAPVIPQRPQATATATTNGDPAPPPVPTSSKPGMASMQPSKPKPLTTATTSAYSPTPSPADSCLKCRDFSAPDLHASKFSRQSIPTQDIAWLSHQLTHPFPSPTDKARALFTWLHHNISYNTHAFFSGTIKSSTPSSTITSGLAVCEGYAGLFAALALASGLQCLVVSGHGKGFGHQPPLPGQPIPPFVGNHAWNAVQIDDGEWQLIDPCWGAGALSGESREYSARFDPQHFDSTNADFGLRHFPSDQSMHFLPPGTHIPTWEQYLIGPHGPGEDVTVCPDGAGKELDMSRFRPAKRDIRVSNRSPNERVQFLFATRCAHFDRAKAGVGMPFPYTLHTGGRKREMLVFRTDSDRVAKGGHWWLDVSVGELGGAGQVVSLNAITVLDGRDARGVGVGEMERSIGRVGWSGKGVTSWRLV